MSKINLSYLKDDLLLIGGETGLTLTVEQLKVVIKDGKLDIGDDIVFDNEVNNQKWYVAEEDTYHIEGYQLMERTFEDAWASETSPKWLANAMDSLRNNEIDYQRIEKVIMEEIEKVEHLTKFYIKGEEIIIDR